MLRMYELYDSKYEVYKARRGRRNIPVGRKSTCKGPVVGVSKERMKD